MKSPSELASPPEAFRDTKEEFREKVNAGEMQSDLQSTQKVSPTSNVSLKPEDLSSAKEGITTQATSSQQKGSSLVARPAIKDHATESRLRRQQFTETRSSSVLSAPTLKEDVMEKVEEEEEQRECSRIIESYSNSADRKMSRSNTISFGEAIFLNLDTSLFTI